MWDTLRDVLMNVLITGISYTFSLMLFAKEVIYDKTWHAKESIALSYHYCILFNMKYLCGLRETIVFSRAFSEVKYNSR